MNSSFINHILVKILTLLRFAIPVMFFCNGLIYANTLNKIQVINNYFLLIVIILFYIIRSFEVCVSKYLIFDLLFFVVIRGCALFQ